MKHHIIEADLKEIYQRDIPWGKLENKTILVTGAYGMLASYVIFMLIYLNKKVGMHINIIAVVKSKEKLIKRFGNIDKNEYFKVYISELDEALEIQEDIHYIIHAASLASPQYYSVCPIEVLKPNIIGNYHLLELSALKKVEGYLFFSTGDIYGVIEGKETIKEDIYGSMDTLDIHNCYSESKRMAETMCKAWFLQKNVPTKIARIWHTYAPTMNVDEDPRVFASFVNDILHGKDIIMKSDGSAKRSFCYISDAVAGFFLVLLCGNSGEAYNICNTEEFYSISQLAEKMVTLYPELNLKVIRKDRSKNDVYVENSVANYIPPDNSKLKSLGWEAKYDITTGFKQVIESLKND